MQDDLTWERNHLSHAVGPLLLLVSRKELRVKLAAKAIRHHLVVEKTWGRRRRNWKFLLEVLTRLYNGDEGPGVTVRRLSQLYRGKKKEKK